MAAVDTLPVLLFAAGGAVACARLGSALFGAGAALCTAAGAGKAAWKFVLALRGRDQKILRGAFRVLMPAGFALMLLSIPAAGAAWAALVRRLLAMPALPLVLLGCAGMALMALFAAKLDKTSARANWLEQWTNTAAQGLFLAALLLA